jgi:hypothetical protein
MSDDDGRHSFPITRRDVLVIRPDIYNGTWTIDLRLWTRTAAGLVATPRGVKVPPDLLADVLAAIQDADRVVGARKG